MDGMLGMAGFKLGMVVFLEGCHGEGERVQDLR